VTLLLDAHSLLWFLADDPKLSPTAKAVLEDPGNVRWLSPISLLEIALIESIECGSCSAWRVSPGPLRSRLPPRLRPMAPLT
jgi:hypothetical protein